MEKEYRVEKDSKRIDSYLAAQESGYSRSYFQRLVKKGLVLLNGKTVSASDKLSAGDAIKVTFPENKAEDFSGAPLDIIHEDGSILVINKPAGISVHPAGRFPKEATIVDLLSGKKGESNKPGAGLSASGRRGIVHRLDRDTSGVMVVAKNETAQFDLMNQFRDRRVRKTYLAIVRGKFTEKKGSIDAPITRDNTNKKKFHVGFGRNAVTEFKVLEACGNYSYLELHPLTGRTHQIRVHLSSIGHPILGDKMYTGTKEIFNDGIEASRQMLHARELTITHPKTKKTATYTAELPADFRQALKVFRSLCVILLLIAASAVFSQSQETQSQEPQKQAVQQQPQDTQSQEQAVEPQEQGSAPEAKKPKAKTSKSAQPSRTEIALKELKEKITDIEDELTSVRIEVDSVTLALGACQQLQDDEKESDSAILELNRKLSLLDQKFEQFKAESRLANVNNKDRQNSDNLRENMNEKSNTATLQERVDDFDTDLALVKKELSRIQENMGIEKAQKAQPPKTEEEEPQEESTLQKLAKAPWLAPAAFVISIIALLVH